MVLCGLLMMVLCGLLLFTGLGFCGFLVEGCGLILMMTVFFYWCRDGALWFNGLRMLLCALLV